jgi:hypothetical protein
MYGCQNTRKNLSLCMCACTCICVCVCVCVGGDGGGVFHPPPLVTIYNGRYVGFSNRKFCLAICLSYASAFVFYVAVGVTCSPNRLFPCAYSLGLK